jgi:5-methylthioadenosine/S-adenosylhomocysteine deaminase
VYILEKYESILIKNGFLLTMKGEGVGSLIDGSVAINGQEIVAVGHTEDVIKEYGNAEHVIDAHGKAVLPGFIDGHIHTGLSLARGLAQDVPEIEWMLKTMSPFTSYYTPEHNIVGSKIGVLEAMKSGTTTFGEIGGNMGPVADNVFIPSGVRANLANTINQIGPESRPDPKKLYIFFEDIGEKKFREGIELIEKYDGAGDGRITGILSPHGADMMDKELLLAVKEKAKEMSKLAHIHVAQGGREELQMKMRYNMTTIQYLNRIGYLDDQLIAAHCHQTTDDEVALLAQKGVRYASCPASIGGIDGITPPLGLFIMNGGKYATIGSDQAPGNGHHNMLVEMKVAALLNKTRHKDPTILPAWKTLRLATIEGAQAIGLGDKIGSLEVGKKADIILLDLKVPHMTPVIYNPMNNVAPNIVYSARGDEVTDVIINGVQVVENRIVKSLNEAKIIENAQKIAVEIAAEAAEKFLNGNGWLAREVKKGLY